MKKIIAVLIILISFVIGYLTDGFNININLNTTAQNITEETYYPPPGCELRSVIGQSQTLSDIIDYANITYNFTPQSFSTDFWAYYKQEGKEDVTHSICIGTMESLASLILKNKDAITEDRTSCTGEKLTFNAYLKGSPCKIYLCNDGYLYFCVDGLTRGFNIGIDDYAWFMQEFKYSSCVWTPENPVTMG